MEGGGYTSKFEEDVEEGLMAKMSLGSFLDHYGIHTAIAALAVIVEDEAKDKKRIIHDTTHGVRVNHRIKCRDKLRSPGARGLHRHRFLVCLSPREISLVSKDRSRNPPRNLLCRKMVRIRIRTRPSTIVGIPCLPWLLVTTMFWSVCRSLLRFLLLFLWTATGLHRG